METVNLARGESTPSFAVVAGGQVHGTNKLHRRHIENNFGDRGTGPPQICVPSTSAMSTVSIRPDLDAFERHPFLGTNGLVEDDCARHRELLFSVENENTQEARIFFGVADDAGAFAAVFVETKNRSAVLHDAPGVGVIAGVDGDPFDEVLLAGFDLKRIVESIAFHLDDGLSKCAGRETPLVHRCPQPFEFGGTVQRKYAV